MEKYEIKQLAKGQAILVEARFLTMRDGDVEYFTEMVDKGVSNIHWSKPENIQMASSLPNLFRKFKAGDMVSPCFWYDRPPAAYYISEASGHFTPEDGLYEVDKDEMPDATVLVRYKGKVISMQACQLELMTPVEERDPYSIEKTIDGATIVLTVKKSGCSQGIEFRYCPGWGGNVFFSEEQCRQHAEAERDRLNAEYRKEQE